MCRRRGVRDDAFRVAEVIERITRRSVEAAEDLPASTSKAIICRRPALAWQAPLQDDRRPG